MPSITDKPKGLKETDTFIIYTPEKCGSTTVLNALKSVGLDAHRCTTKNIKEYHYRDAPTITMVRDPIAWVISSLWESGMEFSDVEAWMATAVQQVYLEWLSNHYRPITGINAYGQFFPMRAGYKIYSIRSLVIGTHRLGDSLAKALCEFLPIYTDREFKPEDFTVEHRAKGEDKFGPEYKEFVDKVKFPLPFLQDVYNGQYCKHFFLRKDRLEWIERWSE